MMDSALYRTMGKALEALREAEANNDTGIQVNIHPHTRGHFSSLIQAADDFAQPRTYQHNHRIPNESGSKYDTCYTRITFSPNTEVGYNNITVFWPSPNYMTGVTP